MKTVIILPAIALALSSLVGCATGSAGLVQRDATGGRVALDGAYMPAMGEARMVMLRACGGRFSYAERGDAVDFRCAGGDPESPTERNAVATR